MTYIIYIIGCAMTAAFAVALGHFIGKNNRDERDDQDQIEYLNKYSDAQRARRGK